MSKTIEKIDKVLLYRDPPFYCPIQHIKIDLDKGDITVRIYYEGLLCEKIIDEISAKDVPKFLAFLGRPERRKLILS